MNFGSKQLGTVIIATCGLIMRCFSIFWVPSSYKTSNVKQWTQLSFSDLPKQYA